MGIIAEQWVVDQRVHLTVHRARGLRRLTGQIGRQELPAHSAIRFAACSSVHGCFMRRRLDVVFADRGGRVLSVCRLAPWRFAACRGASQAFELRAGEAGRLGIAPDSQMLPLGPEEGRQ